MGSHCGLKQEKGVGMRLLPPRGVCKCVRASRGELYIGYFRSVSTDITSTHIDSLEELKDYMTLGPSLLLRRPRTSETPLWKMCILIERFSTSILKSREHTLDLCIPDDTTLCFLWHKSDNYLKLEHAKFNGDYLL